MRGDVGLGNAHGALLTPLGEIPHKYTGDPGQRPLYPLSNHVPSHDIGIDPFSADILSHLVNDKEVNVIQGEKGHPGPGLFEKLGFHGLNLMGKGNLNFSRLMLLIFQQAHADGHTGIRRKGEVVFDSDPFPLQLIRDIYGWHHVKLTNHLPHLG